MSVESVGDKYQILQWTTNLKIQWTSALNSSPTFSIGGPRLFCIDNLWFELGMALFLYGALLREHGLEMLNSDFVESTALFGKAARVYQYLSQYVLPPLEPKASTMHSISKPNLPDMSKKKMSQIMICVLVYLNKSIEMTPWAIFQLHSVYQATYQFLEKTMPL